MKIKKSISKSESHPIQVKQAMKWFLTILPLGGVVWSSFLPLPNWMQQALVLGVMIWFMVFLLFDTFFLGW